jgi:hypothetical protein
MNAKKVTTYIVLCTVVLLIVWDVIAINIGGTEASISSIVIAFAYKMPMFSFSVGFICGHLFWRMRTNKDTLEIDNEKH